MSIAAHARFKDGTIKHACFAALYAAGAAGLTVRTTRRERVSMEARRRRPPRAALMGRLTLSGCLADYR